MKEKKFINSKMTESQAKSSLLAQSSWWTLNKAITILLGFDASLLLSDLVAKEEYFRIKDQLDEDGFFFNLRKDIKYDTGLSEQRQIKALDVLKDKNLISTVRKGVPPKLYYKSNPDKIMEVLLEMHK
jgi:hypothetical protein